MKHSRKLTIEVEIDEYFEFRYPGLLMDTTINLVGSLPGVKVKHAKNSPVIEEENEVLT